MELLKLQTPHMLNLRNHMNKLTVILLVISNTIAFSQSNCEGNC